MFFIFQWPWHNAIYLAYRIIIACYSIACLLALVITSVEDGNEAYLIPYLTIWTYIFLCLYQLSSLFTCIYCICRTSGSGSDKSTFIMTKIQNNSISLQNLQKTNEDAVSNGNISIATEDPKSLNNLKSTTDLLDSQDCNTTWYMKLTWFLSTIVYVFGIIVTIVYFSALFPYIGVTKGFIHDLDVHAFNTLQIFIDMAIIARPVRLLHAIYPLIYGAIYLIFSVIYWSQDKKNNVLYPGVLDWNQPERTGLNMGLLAVLGIPLLQMILFGIFRLRLYVYKRVYGIDYLS